MDMDMDMAAFAVQDEDVEDLFGMRFEPNTDPEPITPTEPPLQPMHAHFDKIPIEQTEQTTPPQVVHSNPDPQPIPPQALHTNPEPQLVPQIEEQKVPQQQNVIVMLGYEDDDKELQPPAPIDLDLPVVDSLQPDELCLSLQNTIQKMSDLNPSTDAHIIMAYKANLVEQLEKLQIISAAIESLNNMQKTADNLPKNEKTGYPDVNAINLALREHSFFAQQISVFGMLLCEISDVNKLKETYSSEYTDLLAKKMCETIASDFEYQHLLFHYNAKTLIILVYVKDEEELMCAGTSVVKLLTSHSFEVNDQTLHSNISCGAAIYVKDHPDTKNPFDFRTWLKNAELGLQKANNCGKNQCAIFKEDEVLRAIVPSMNDSGSKSNHNKKEKSTLSLLARSRSHGHVLGSSTGNVKMSENNNQLQPREIRASIRLYDKLSRLDSSKPNAEEYKLLGLSLCRRMKESGANYNFQHPKHDGNTILMLCCLKNLDILIKYFCLKVHEEIDFSLVNTAGNNALMIAIGNKNVSDNIVQLIVKKTTDKTVMNHDGKTAVQLAQAMGRNELIAVLQGI